MNKTVEFEATDECTRCSTEPEALHVNRVYMDDMLDDYSYDNDSYDDSYYDMTDTIDDVYELSSLLPASDTIDITDSHIEGSVLCVDEETTRQLPPIVEILDETFEENNNDPNNNMDSIQTSLEAPPVAAAERLNDEPRVPSPLPGCSKDSVVLPDEPPVVKMLLEQTRHVLGLVSRIHRDSVFEARQRDHVAPVSELRLWDLIPEADRLEFPESIMPNEKSKVIRQVGTKTDAQATTNPSNQSLTFKRGSDEDVCTIGCKRSASTPEISLSVPMANPGPISKVPSTSQIVTNPKIRPVSLARLTTTQAPVKVTETPSAFSTPKTVTTTGTVGRGAVPKILPEGQRHGNHAGEKTLTRPSARPSSRELETDRSLIDSPLPAQLPLYRPKGRPAPAHQQQYRPNVPPAPAKRLATGLVPHAQTQNRQAQPATTVVQPANRLTHPVPHTQTKQNRQAQPAATAVQPANRLATGPVPHTQTQQIRQAQPAATVHQPVYLLATGPVLPTQILQNRQAQPAMTVQQPVNWIATGPVLPTQTLQNRQAQPAAIDVQTANGLATGPVPHAYQVEYAAEPTNRIVCMEIYYKLINIFPNVDRAYVKKLCPPDWGPGDRDAQIASFVEMILEGGDTVPKIDVNDYEDREKTDGRTSNPDDIYENLLGIFPDADPHFLRDFAEKNATGPDSLKQFVERNLEQRDYPTREQYLARLKITEQQRQYTHGFDVKQYLSIIPDPAKYFTDPKRCCRNSTVAFEFLKSHFNKMRVNTISRAYSQYRYNISLTAEHLERNGSDLRSKRWCTEMPTEDILLLQEIAYIKHKTEITDYIANAKKVEENEFNMLKAQNLLLECQCCFDAECIPSKCCNCENGHIFCNECVVNGTNAKLGDGDTHINCFINCGSEFSLSVLQRVLAPTTFSILLQKRQAAEVMEAGVEGLVSCPFCHFASIPPEGDKIFKCLNPECTKESCRLCKELSHVPLKCDEVMKADKARLYIEEKMTAALARTCYKCQKSFFKEEGCNKITCVCGAIMCYLCDQPIKDYSHFRGQGSDDQTRCPLYSDTIRLDAVAVHKVAEQAQLEVLKQNPNVRIDTTRLLPAIPRPQRGPHQAVLNADEMPRRAQRVFDLPPI